MTSKLKTNQIQQAITAHQEGKLEEAEILYRKILEIEPTNLVVNNNSGVLMESLGRLDEAETSFKKAIKLKPNNVYGYFNLGNTLVKLNKLNEAETNFKKVIELKPDYPGAYYNLGNIFKNLNRVDEAETNFRKAIELKPDLDFLLGAFLDIKILLCLWDESLQSELQELIKKIDNGEKVTIPFPLLSLIDDPELHRKAAKIYSNHRFPKSNLFPKISKYHNHEKIKIGYFSTDFNSHPVGRLTAELYELHDRKKFEIHAFSFGLDKKDEINTRIRKGVDHFHDVHKISEIDLVKLARSLEIDIAIDLTGFTSDNKTGIFSMLVAPIQINYLGYSSTMGGDCMNYLIADKTIIPEQNKEYYSEKIVYLPNSYMVNESKVKMSEKLFTRQDVGLPAEGFVFCCFNNHYKINPTTFAGWMRILKAVDGSVLWLRDTKSMNKNNSKNNLKKEAKKVGIDESRIIFAPRLDLYKDHLSRQKLADLFLDTLPCNAHTIASDALRMGLPVLTCIGKAFAGRVAASLLKAVNLPEMITTTQDGIQFFKRKNGQRTTRISN